MSYGEVCECGCYREHHDNHVGKCLRPGPTFPCAKKAGKACLKYEPRPVQLSDVL